MTSLDSQELYVVWIDKNVFNSENKKYLEQLGYYAKEKVNHHLYQERNRFTKWWSG